MFSSAVQIVVVIFLMIGVGYVCQWRGWLGENASGIISRLTLRVGMPGLVFSNILQQYNRDMLVEGAYSLIVPLVIIGGMFLLSKPLAVWLRIPRHRQGVFRALFSFGNTLFIGMPVCRALFGEAGITDVLLYYLANTTIWWVIGAPAVARDGGADVSNPLKRVATPPLVAWFVSILLVLVGAKPPAVLLTAAGYLGAMVTPLSMLFIGCTLYSMCSHGLRWQKGYGVVLLTRVVLGPLICLPMCRMLGISGNMLGVFFVLSGMPSQTQTCLWAQENGSDAEYAAGAVTLSTLLSLVAIPAYTWVLGFLM